MKILLASLLLVISITPLNAQKNFSELKKNPRAEKIINSYWTFNYFPDENADKGYESPGYDDSRWPAVSIPHTWSTYETTGEVHPFLRSASEKDNPYWWTGWGWYRKHFTVNPSHDGQKIFIEFEGVQKYCKVWFNGKYLGDHKGGYGSFDFDITELVNQGKDNVLAVAVNNRQKDQFNIPPMAAGNFNVYGGIYRDVTLVIKDKLYIPMQGSASHEGGTFITTPSVSVKAGIVRIQTYVRNDNSQPKNCILNSYIIDASGKVVQLLKANYAVGPNQIYKFDQTSKPVNNPHLWSPDDPYVYKVYSEIVDGSRVTDAFTSPLGFRWFKWDYRENFLYINGKKMVIHGGNHNQEYPWLGDAVPKWITEMDFRDMSENLKYNFIRSAHYPNDRLVYDLADKLGTVIEEESPSIRNQEFSVAVQEQQMKEMIRRDRNHPSIMFWSMGSETNRAVDSKFAVSEDTTRILTTNRVTGGSAGKYIKLTEKNLQVENLLRCTVRGWYNTDVKDLEPEDTQHCGTEEQQQNILKASGLLGTGNLCSWLYEDYGADRENLNAPLYHVNPEGYVDLYRVPKYAYYFWQATYYDKPMAFILPHYWRTQYLGQKKDIVVNSNCDRIELKVNGKIIGTQTPDQSNFHSLTFRNVMIEKGTITATGTKNGLSVMGKVTMAGEPAKILLKSSAQKIKADRASVAIITADITDTQGNHVYGAANTVKWSVSGPATLAGPDLYESDMNKLHSLEGIWYIDMPVANVIRSTGKPGKIRVIVSGSGLTSGSIEIDAEELKPDNSVITEPIVDDKEKNAVIRPVLVASRLEEVPEEIRKAYDDLSFTSADRQGYIRSVRDYIMKNNPSVDSATIEFRTLTGNFATQLITSSGRLIADEYNFGVDHYNNCRLISGYIDATKLPPLFKEGVRKYYSDLIIKQGNEKNAGEEMNWLNWIPSGGTVVVSVSDNKVIYPKGTIVTALTDLQDLIVLVYPVFRSYSDEAKERALTFIGKMNPYAHATTLSGQAAIVDQNQGPVKYTVEKDKPILIPLIKFITE